ncbi:cytochrome P450 [Lentzea sp. NBRC 105346]|uniref:cytochrome P450 n=1 Tax=Lentzea sp. NBRC 105346 TaxID=3032205 RepID=UPI0024A0A76D|nr:cytochrome P450 [Lentzea sp. NBRC 105346]GLZ36039.1 cytochrome P450 [Lentzea sp. NBRC 105346]
MSQVPGPKGLPLLGSALALRRDLLGTYERARAEFGDIVRLTAGPMTLYNVFHPDHVQHVLATNAANYRKDNQANEDIAALFGNGLLTSQDETWRGQRRIVQPIFTRNRVAAATEDMALESHRLVSRWFTSDTVDLNREMVTYAMRVVGRILFGADVDEAAAVCTDTFPVLGEYVRRRGMSPRPLPRHWPTPANRRAARARARLVGVADELVRRRRLDSSGDLLSLLLTASDPETGDRFDDVQVRDQVLVFLLAGHDTTATTLTFTLYLLARHPEVQEAVHGEVSAVLSGRLPESGDIPKLVNTAAAVKEAMRLYPPAYFVGRLTPAGDEIGGYAIPAGGTVLTSPWVTHRHPAFWDAPSAFRPERFAPDAEVGRHRYSYFPFGGGPRACIGMQFALTEAVVAVATIVQRYRLGPVRSKPSLATGITLRPAGPVLCGLSAR